ncbi:MAG: biopolymer transporter ExbD [Planctomycetota bacterium]
MNFRPRRGADETHELPMTSLIDVVFLLLIFFMLTASFVRENELQSALLADRSGAPGSADLLPQFVQVRPAREGFAFELGQRVIASQDDLREMLSRLPKDAGVIVRASAEAPVDGVAAAVQAATDAGYTKVSYVPAGS